MTQGQKGKALTITLISIGAIALIGGVYLGIKALGGTKKNSSGGAGNIPVIPNDNGTASNTPPSVVNTANNSGGNSGGSFPLKMGSRNQYVSQLQMDLEGLGQDITTDGIFGKQTQSALISVTGKATVDSPSELEAIRMRQFPASADTSSWVNPFDFSKIVLS